MSALPPNEQRRRAMQLSLLQGWGMFYDMSYTDHVLLPQGARITLALCEVLGHGEGRCLTEARIDWPDKSGLQATVRPGLHAYDRSYAQLHVAAGGCNVSVTSGGGEKLLLVVGRVVDGLQPLLEGLVHRRRVVDEVVDGALEEIVEEELLRLLRGSNGQ